MSAPQVNVEEELWVLSGTSGNVPKDLSGRCAKPPSPELTGRQDALNADRPRRWVLQSCAAPVVSGKKRLSGDRCPSQRTLVLSRDASGVSGCSGGVPG